jgi:hypothetical protein
MKRRFVAVLGLFLVVPVWAHDYPTVDRVEYVLECMWNHSNRQEYLYKCSCAIDEIAKELTYDQYVEAATAARGQGFPGERGGAFRDPEGIKSLAKKYRELQNRANAQCVIK